MTADNLPVPARAAPPILPAEYDADTLARLAALDAASDGEAAGNRPDNTVRSYASDWRVWTEFCIQLQVPVTAATRGTLRAFVKWLWEYRKAAYSTVDRRLAGVTVTLRHPPYNLVVDPNATAAARQLLKDYRKKAEKAEEPARGRGKAKAIRLEQLRAIAAAFPPDDTAALRDRAMVLLGFSIAARRAELAGLRLRHITAHENGLLVDVRVSKVEPRTVPVPYGKDPLTCPVLAWQAWKAAAGLTHPDRHAFRRVHRTGKVLPDGMTPQRVGQLITAAGERAGIQIRFTGHSVRSGMATEARRAGKDRKAIAAITGHAPGSKVLDGYMQIVDQWDEKDNALIGLM